MTKSTAHTHKSTPGKSKAAPKHLSRRSVERERKPPDAPRGRHPYEDGDLVGESQFSTEEAGERMQVDSHRTPGGPPDRNPFTVTPGTDMGRRALEDATEAPAQDRFEPQSADIEAELEVTGGPDDEWGEDLGEIEADEEPDDERLRRSERPGG